MPTLVDTGLARAARRGRLNSESDWRNPVESLHKCLFFNELNLPVKRSAINPADGSPFAYGFALGIQNKMVRALSRRECMVNILRDTSGAGTPT